MKKLPERLDSDRKQAEEDREKLLYDMNERIKELDCFYGISKIIEKPGISLEEIFQGTVELFSSAYQCPEITCARIVFENSEFKTENFKITKWKQSSDIKIAGKKAGDVEVYYLQEKPQKYEGPFLAEERKLIDAVAERLGRIAERKQGKKEIRTQKQQMEFVLGITKTGINIIDSDFNMRYIDSEWQKVYGDPAGKKCYQYFMGRSEICPRCGIPTALKTKKPTVTEEILVKEGNRPVQVTTIPFQNEQGEWLVAEVNVDITERKKADEELQQKMESLEKFHKLSVGRELKMVELKDKIKEMEEKLK